MKYEQQQQKINKIQTNVHSLGKYLRQASIT